jgi:hypothetical protein
LVDSPLPGEGASTVGRKLTKAARKLAKADSQLAKPAREAPLPGTTRAIITQKNRSREQDRCAVETRAPREAAEN